MPPNNNDRVVDKVGKYYCQVVDIWHIQPWWESNSIRESSCKIKPFLGHQLPTYNYILSSNHQKLHQKFYHAIIVITKSGYGYNQYAADNNPGTDPARSFCKMAATAWAILTLELLNKLKCSHSIVSLPSIFPSLLLETSCYLDNIRRNLD